MYIIHAWNILLILDLHDYDLSPFDLHCLLTRQTADRVHAMHGMQIYIL